MPRSKVTYGLTPQYIEFIHDRGIEIFWPGLEPVKANDCLHPNLLDSAAKAPFQSGYGVEFYPTLLDKAAYQFFSIAGGHIFGNGNKRTAAIVLDQFLLANSVYLLISNPEMTKLAEDTASYHERNETDAVAIQRIKDALTPNMIELRVMRKSDPNSYRLSHLHKNRIRHSGGCIAYHST